MRLFLWIVGGYLVVGVLVATLLMQTPYADNGAILITLLWPLFILGMFFG
jgi:hypothetical protein